MDDKTLFCIACEKMIEALSAPLLDDEWPDIFGQIIESGDCAERLGWERPIDCYWLSKTDKHFQPKQRINTSLIELAPNINVMACIRLALPDSCNLTIQDFPVSILLEPEADGRVPIFDGMARVKKHVIGHGIVIPSPQEHPMRCGHDRRIERQKTIAVLRQWIAKCGTNRACHKGDLAESGEVAHEATENFDGLLSEFQKGYAKFARNQVELHALFIAGPGPSYTLSDSEQIRFVTYAGLSTNCGVHVRFENREGMYSCCYGCNDESALGAFDNLLAKAGAIAIGCDFSFLNIQNPGDPRSLWIGLMLRFGIAGDAGDNVLIPNAFAASIQTINAIKTLWNKSIPNTSVEPEISVEAFHSMSTLDKRHIARLKRDGLRLTEEEAIKRRQNKEGKRTIEGQMDSTAGSAMRTMQRKCKNPSCLEFKKRTIFGSAQMKCPDCKVDTVLAANR